MSDVDQVGQLGGMPVFVRRSLVAMCFNQVFFEIPSERPETYLTSALLDLRRDAGHSFGAEARAA